MHQLDAVQLGQQQDQQDQMGIVPVNQVAHFIRAASGQQTEAGVIEGRRPRRVRSASVDPRAATRRDLPRTIAGLPDWRSREGETVALSGPGTLPVERIQVGRSAGLRGLRR